MENFTDIFGEDLANLEDLGQLGGFPGGHGQPDMDPNQVQRQGGGQGGMDPGGHGGSMTGHGGHGGPDYSQQQFQQYSQYRPGAPGTGGPGSGHPGGGHPGAGHPGGGHPHQQYPGYNNGPARSSAGYPSNPGNYSGPQAMMSGGPSSGGRQQQQGYPGYPPTQGNMAGWPQQNQGMMTGPRMYGQPGGYPPGGPGMPGHYPGYDQRASTGGMNYRQGYPGYPGQGGGQGMSQGYPGQGGMPGGQGGMPGYHPAASGMKAGYPPTSSQHSVMPGAPGPYGSSGASQSSVPSGPNQYGNATAGQYHMSQGPGQYPGSMPGAQSSRVPQAGGHAGPGGQGGGGAGHMTGQQPNMSPASQHGMSGSGMMQAGGAMGPSALQRQMSGQVLSPSSPAMGPTGMPSQMMPGGGPSMPPTSMAPNMSGSGGPPHMSPSHGMVMSQSNQQQQQNSQMQSQGSAPGGGSSPMYRSPFPPQPSPSQQQQQSPHSQASPMPQRSPLPPTTNSPAGHPMSPVTSPAPPRTPNSVQGRMTPTGGPSTPQGSTSSLQQLEQMVMPGAGGPAAALSSEASQQQARSSPNFQQVGSPLGAAGNLKNPLSPGMRGPGNPLSPQQWSQSKPGGQVGKQYPGPGGMHGMYPGYQQHPGMPGAGGMPQSAAGHQMQHPGMSGYPGPNMGGMHPGMEHMQQQGGPGMPNHMSQQGHIPHSASSNMPSGQHHQQSHQQQHQQQHPSHQQHQAMSNNTPSVGPNMARNMSSEEMSMSAGGQGLSKGGLSAGPGRPGSSAGGLPPGGVPIGHPHHQQSNISGMSPSMGGVNPSAYQQSQDRLAPPHHTPHTPPTSESVPYTQQQLHHQQQDHHHHKQNQHHQQQQQQQHHLQNQNMHQQQTQPSTTMLPSPQQQQQHQQQQHHQQPPQQQLPLHSEQHEPTTTQPQQMPPKSDSYSTSTTMLSPEQQQQQRSHYQYDQDDHRADSQQTELPRSQPHHSEKTNIEPTTEDHVSSQTSAGDHDNPESTFVNNHKQSMDYHSSNKAAESSTERAVPTSTSGDDGEMGDEDEDDFVGGGAIGGRGGEADNGSGGEDDRPDTTVKQSPPGASQSADTDMMDKQETSESTLTTPPPPPVSDASAPSTSTVGMPPQQQGTTQQQSQAPASMGHSQPDMHDPRTKMSPADGAPQPPMAASGMTPPTGGVMRPPYNTAAPPHGYPGPAMGPGGPEAGMQQPPRMMGPSGGPYGPTGPGGVPMGPMGPMIPPNHPIMMEMQALHQHMQQLCTKPQNKKNKEMMIELQGRMRHLQAQAAQMQQQAAAAAGMPWPPNHPGMPQGAAAPPSNSSQEHPKVSSGQGATGGVPQLPPQQTAGENAAGDKMSVNEQPTENEKMEPKEISSFHPADSSDSAPTPVRAPREAVDVYEFGKDGKDPYAENFEEESMAEFRKKNMEKKKPGRKPKPKEEGANPEEVKTPKKRGPKPKIKLDENGMPIEPKPKRQYNRKKKPEPGSLDESKEKINLPPDSIMTPVPTAAAQPTVEPVPDTSGQERLVENGEIDPATSTATASSEAASTSAGSGGVFAAKDEKDEGAPSATGEAAATAAAAAEDKKKSPPQPKLKANTPKRPKTNKTLLNFNKKNRKRKSSEGSDLDLEQTPPPSPLDDDGIEKRRSGRNTKRKKYVDDVPFSLNEEDLKKLPKDALIPTAALDDILGPEDSEPGTADTSLNEGDTSLASQSGPNYAFVDPSEGDTMIVQIVLGCRMATREIEEEEDMEKEESKKEENSGDNKDENNDKTEADSTKANEENEAKTSEKQANTEKNDDNEKDIDDKKAEDIKDNKDDTETDSAAAVVPEKVKKPAKTMEVEEYLVKFKNFSYLHCQWLTEVELLKGDKRVSNKIKRFHQKRQSSGNVLDYSEEDPFNPDYIEVDRVLDQSQHTDEDTGLTTKHYLVKWRSLPYEDCTWELEADVDPEKIKDYLRWKDPPTEKKTDKPRPKKSEWVEFKESPNYKNNNKLREYQLEGVNWLNFSWYNQRNCLLADEMGLGKTIQSLAWVHSIWSYGIRGPFLVIAPLSTIPNWQREFELWTDMNVIVYHGSQTSRNMIQEYEMYYKDEEGERIPKLFKFHVLITTYECIITDIMDLKDISWRACVIDEAHRLKNQKCKLLEGLRLLNIEARLLLSGTPLQNNINELFSLLSFLEPAQFTNINEFTRDFGDMQNEDQVLKLQTLLKPLMLRRMKEDVEKSLKPKEETIVEVELTNIQKKYYRGILEKNFTFLKSSSYSNVPNLMNTMMELRKCCIHPYLLKGAEESIQADYRSSKKDYNDEEDLYYKALVHASGKMVLLDKLLPKLKANGNRVLIFSQMVKMLDILEDYLIRRKYPFERIDGRIRGNLRQAAIDRFCRPDSDRFVFLLCTKAGGLGINLTAADTCIIYDSDWNPQNDLQAQARCHRIGQKKMVKIYRLVTKNTYEREMLDRAGLKLGLDKAVLQSMNTSQGGKDVQASNTLSKQDVETLLKKGAYGALMDDDNAGDKFCEEDIEDILSRRATTITHAEEKGSTFSKATFSTSDSATDISIDDPDFWKKWAKKAEIEEIDETMKLMMVEPRNRRKIDRLGGGGLDTSQIGSDLDSSSDSDSGSPGKADKSPDKESGGRTRDQRIKDKLKSMKSGGGKGKRPRRGAWEEDDDYLEEERDVEYGSWNKSDLFRLEKGVMAYGWGRWEEVLTHAQLRKGWTHEDVEDALRLSCIYSLIIYKGDENIKTFMWDLIAPGAGNTSMRNHSGLSAPVPRGRKNNKPTKGKKDDKPEGAEWANEEKYEPDLFLDKNYRKHLDRFHNKLLLRIRLLYYIQHEVLGDFMEMVANPNVAATKVPLNVPTPEGFVSGWWDQEADKSLLIGVYRYGFERYSMMRLDPGLCFLKRCGPPDNEAVQAELDNLTKTDDTGLDDEDDDSSSATPSGSGSRPPSVKPDDEQHNASGFLPFPDHSLLNSRVRKLVSAFQRANKKEEERQAAKEKREERRERIEQVMREREKQKVEQQQRKWSRREESNFLRTILAFGVDKKKKKYNWDRFRLLGRLETKYEDTMTEYYLAFTSMCKRVAGLPLTEEEELVSASVEPVDKDKARKVLERVDFLSRLRESVAVLPDLADRLDSLAEPALDLPEWWIPGKHDADLVVGAARHGVSRMEYFVLNDIELCFKDILKRSLSNEPLVSKEEFAAWQKRHQERKQNGATSTPAKKSTTAESDNGSEAGGKKNGKQRRESGKSAASHEDGDDAEKNGDIEEIEDDKKENGKDSDEKDKEDEEPMDTTENDTDNNKVAKEKDKEKLKLEKARAVERAAIQAPQLNLQQIEAAIAKGGAGYDHEMINDLMAQTYAASVKWPRDSVLMVRLQHILEAVESGKWPVPENFVLLDQAVDNGTETPPADGSATPSAPAHARDTSTPLSETSEVSGFEDANVLTHGGLANRKKRGRRPLDCPEEKTKLRGMLQPSTPMSATSVVSSNKASTEDSLSESSGNRGAVVEETGLSGILDLKSGQSSKGSKLESALDKLGLQKRKLSDAPADDKSKKKKRLDDLLSGLHAGKGNSLPEKKDSPMDNLMKKSAESSRTDLNKLQEMLGPLGGNPGDAKVQKWLADQMGVTPERPTTPGSSGAAANAAASSSKRPASTASSAGGLMEWMSKLSPDDHVSMINRSTGKRLSGSDGPKLKYLPQWLMEHPLYEVDPKWMEEMRLKDEMKKKGPGRPNLDESHSKKMSSPSTVGPSYNSMASLGLDPKNPMSALAALDPKNPNSLAALYGLDPKKLDPMTAAMLGLGDPKNPMKMDPMMMAALSMDPKMLQSLGIDPKKLASMASPATSKAMERAKQPQTSSAASAMAGIDPMMLAAFGIDPKNPKLDPAIAQALGLDPKNPKFDPMVLASLGLDPKNPNSTLLAAMAAMDPSNQLASMYGLMPPGFPMPGGMDMLGGKGKHSPQPKDKPPAPSPRSSSSQREGPSPRPPSRASQSSRDGGRSTPRSSHPASSYAQASPRTTLSSSSMFGGMNPFGLDPKLLQASGIDPKMLASMDPKMLASFGMDPKMMAMLDLRMASLASMDLKALMQMDPKLLQSAGIDPKMLQQLMDPKTMASMGLDPKMFGLDPKQAAPAPPAPAMGGLDPKLLQSMGIDPKMLAGLDPKMLQSMGIDPKLFGIPDPKPTSAASQFDLKALGLDPKMLAAMDPKLFSDPKFLASLDPKMMFGGLDPKLFGIDPKMFGMSSAYTSSGAASPSYSSRGPTSSSGASTTVLTSATGTTMSIPSSSSFSGLMDPRLLGLDPKMLQGLDEKALKSLGLDPNIVKSLLGADKPRSSGSSGGSGSRTSSSSSSRPTTSTSTTFAGLDPKMFPGMDPKTLSMMDPKMLAAMSDPKILSAMYGMDMKALASMDPKLLASFGIDPKWLDPKAGTSSSGHGSSSSGTSLPPTSMGGIDAKLLASMGIDAKTLAAMDPKVLASYGIDMKTIQALEAQAKGSSAPTPSSSGNSMSNDLSKSIAGLDPKLLAAAGIDPKLLAGMDAKTLASLGLDAKSLQAAFDPKNVPKSMPQGIDPKMFGLDAKTLASMGIDPKMLSDPKFLASMGLDPKMLASMGIDLKALSSMGGASPAPPPALDPKSLAGIDPKMLAQIAAMDPKSLAAMGLDPKTLASMGIDPKMLASLGMDPKALSAMGGMDPKTSASMAAAGLDPKLLASMGMDPKTLAALSMDPKSMAAMGLDPKMMASLGMDPKMLASLGMDPKTLAAMGLDPKAFDPKSLASMGFDPKAMGGIDPKLLASMGLDPKALAGIDPKMLASMGLDPKLASDPNLLAMYAMGMPGMMPPMSMANGIGTPIPGTSGGSSSKAGSGGSSAPAKPKPGTVAAALQEKKESEKTRGEAAGAPSGSGSIHEDGGDDKSGPASGISEAEEEEVRRGLTSEERVLLREKKKERLMKEVESESGAGAAGSGSDEGGLNLSVSSSRHSDHPSSTKLEALLNKPIDEPASSSSTPPTLADDRPLNNGDVTPTSGDSV